MEYFSSPLINRVPRAFHWDRNPKRLDQGVRLVDLDFFRLRLRPHGRLSGLFVRMSDFDLVHELVVHTFEHERGISGNVPPSSGDRCSNRVFFIRSRNRTCVGANHREFRSMSSLFPPRWWLRALDRPSCARADPRSPAGQQGVSECRYRVRENAAHARVHERQPAVRAVSDRERLRPASARDLSGAVRVRAGRRRRLALGFLHGAGLGVPQGRGRDRSHSGRRGPGGGETGLAAGNAVRGAGLEKRGHIGRGTRAVRRILLIVGSSRAELRGLDFRLGNIFATGVGGGCASESVSGKIAIGIFLWQWLIVGFFSKCLRAGGGGGTVCSDVLVVREISRSVVSNSHASERRERSAAEATSMRVLFAEVMVTAGTNLISVHNILTFSAQRFVFAIIIQHSAHSGLFFLL